LSIDSAIASAWLVLDLGILQFDDLVEGITDVPRDPL